MTGIVDLERGTRGYRINVDRSASGAERVYWTCGGGGTDVYSAARHDVERVARDGWTDAEIIAALGAGAAAGLSVVCRRMLDTIGGAS